MGKTLILLTSEFPYGRGETFIESELPVLARHFSKIVLVSNDTDSQQTRQLPSNVETLRVSYRLNRIEKCLSLLAIFSKIFWSELLRVRNVYNLGLKKEILNSLFISRYKSQKFGKLLKGLASKTGKEDTTVYSYWSNDMALAVAFAMRKEWIKKGISRVHGWDLYFERSKCNYLPYRSYLVAHLSAVFSISEDGINYINKHWHIAERKVYLSRLGTLSSQYELNQIVPSSPKIHIVSISNIIPVKRVNLILDGLKLLKDKTIEWTHIGGGTGFESLLARAKRSESTNEKLKINLLGPISNKEVHALLENSTIDLLINASVSEGIPVSMMEALSFGIPIIGTAVGGVPEIIKNNHNGYLLPPNPKAQDIATSILAHANLPERAKIELRKNARNYWQENFNAEKNYTQFIAQMESLDYFDQHKIYPHVLKKK